MAGTLNGLLPAAMAFGSVAPLKLNVDALKPDPCCAPKAGGGPLLFVAALYEGNAGAAVLPA